MSDSDTKQRPSARARLGWILPPVLALLAIAFQYAFDVPKAEMVPRPSPEERRKEEAKKRKELREANRKRKEARTVKRWTGRSADEVATLRREWMTQSIADEPHDQRFRKHHEALLRSAVTQARTKALDGAKPTAIQIRPACHTIRCTLELCGPEDLIDNIAELLPKVEVEPKLGPEGPLFQELREIEPRHLPKNPRENFTCRRWLLSFDRDDAQIRDLRI